MRLMSKLVGLISLVSLFASGAYAQMLPEGIGAVYMGSRQFNTDVPYFNSSGKATTMSERFDMNYNGEFLRSGKGGTDLKSLYDNLRAYETKRGSQDHTTADDLELGVQKAQVDLKFDAKVLGFGYGLTDQWTLLLGIPFMTAAVDADINVTGTNNALAIKNRLGDAAFDELKDGLDKASRINRATIMSKIYDEYKYKDISHWEYSGLGDVLLGARTNWQFTNANRPSYTLMLTSYLSLPTGSQYDPDALAQVPTSRGYYALDVASDHKFKWDRFTLGSELEGILGLPQKTSRRVPVGNEVLVSPDRKVDVMWSPGPEIYITTYAAIGPSAYQAQYKLGLSQHFEDHFSGPIEGDYDLMGSDSASQEIFHEASVTLSTVDLFNSQKFFMPFIVTLMAHDSIGGRSSLGKRYVELTFMTFFKTGAHREATPVRDAVGSGLATNSQSKRQ